MVSAPNRIDERLAGSARTRSTTRTGVQKLVRAVPVPLSWVHNQLRQELWDLVAYVGSEQLAHML